MTTDQRRATRLRHLVLALVGLAFVGHALATAGWLYDDAYISFRYARNLVEGKGLVFHPGERVEGFTNFSWTLLSAVVIALGGSPAFVMPVLGTLAGIALVVLVAHEGRRLAELDGRDVRWAGLPGAVVIAASTDVARYAVSGLETVLFAVLLTYAVTGVVAQRPVRFAIATALAFLTRPEAGLVGVLGVATLAATGRDERNGRSLRPAATATAILAAIVLPYLAWKQLYFGSIFPNTMHAKPPDLRSGFAYVGKNLPPLAFVILAAVVSVATTRLRGEQAKYLGLWVVLNVAVALEGGDWMTGHRMLVPALPLLAIAADATLTDALSRPRNRAAAARTAILVGAVACVPLQFVETRERAIEAEYRAQIDLSRREVYATLLYAGVKSIGTFDVGLLGWVARDARILDLGGLVDREIARSPGHYYDKRPSVAYLESRAPDVFLFTSAVPPVKDPVKGTVLISSWYECEDYVKALPWFRETYRYERTFTVGQLQMYYLHVFAKAR